MFKTNKIFIIAVSALAFAPCVAQADDIVVELDKTKLLTVSTAPATVVVGNPSIADVTVNGNQVFLQGIGYGNTNIIMLDASGSQIAYLDVIVKQSTKQTAVIFSNGKKHTLSCTPNCENTLSIGDDQNIFGKVAGDVQGKRGLASGVGVQTSVNAQQQPAPVDAAAPAAAPAQ